MTERAPTFYRRPTLCQQLLRGFRRLKLTVRVITVTWPPSEKAAGPGFNPWAGPAARCPWHPIWHPVWHPVRWAEPHAFLPLPVSWEPLPFPRTNRRLPARTDRH